MILDLLGARYGVTPDVAAEMPDWCLEAARLGFEREGRSTGRQTSVMRF